MKYQGVIFDFNGTLFWDTPLHNRAWDNFLKVHGIKLTDTEKNEKIHGKTNQDILSNIFNINLSDEEVFSLILEKETIYHDLCLESEMKLAEGAIDFFEFLIKSCIPFTIATASGKENIVFYFEYFKLEKWFSFDHIVYNDGTFRGKPSPDIFLIAANKLKTDPQKIIVFEDSISGIKAAENAGVGKIVIVNSNKENYSNWSHTVITTFKDFDKSMFAKVNCT